MAYFFIIPQEEAGSWRVPVHKYVQLYLGLDVSVVIVLKQKGGRFGVIFPGCDVQSRQPHFAFGVVLQEDGHCLVVTLLERHRQGRKAILGKQKEKISINFGKPGSQLQETVHLIFKLKIKIDKNIGRNKYYREDWSNLASFITLCTSFIRYF